MKIIPNYHPPSDYRRPTKTQEKVYVPVNDYPEINFSMILTQALTVSHLFSSFAVAAANRLVQQTEKALLFFLPSSIILRLGY